MEAGILLTAIILSLVAMQIYVKRAIQGRLRQGTDAIGDAYDPAATQSTSSMTHASRITTDSSTVPGNRTATSTVGAYSADVTYGVEITTTTVTTHYDDTTRSSSEQVAAP